MKKEDLVKKLEDIKTPDIELLGHKNQLKTALMQGEYPARDKGRGIIDLLQDAFIPRRKVWLTALAGTLAIALIAGLAVTLPSPSSKDNAVLAKEIALNDPEVQALIGDKELEEDDIEVIDNTDDGYSSVFIRVDSDSIIMANVIMGIPGDKQVEVIETEMVPITDAKKQEIRDIASADPEIKALLDLGAYIYQYYMDYIPAYLAGDSVNSVWDKVSALAPLCVKDQQVICDELVEYTIRVWMELDGARYFFMINMLDKTMMMDLTELGNTTSYTTATLEGEPATIIIP